MTREDKLEEAKRLYETANADQRYVLESLFPELKESERIRKAIYNTLKYLETELYWDSVDEVDILDAYAWLEEQREQKQLDYEHADIPQKDFAPIEHKMLNAGEVIEWLKPYNEIVGNITKQFKKDFGL